MKRYVGMGFHWSDAWLLLAVAVAAKGKIARLSEVIGAADCMNRAIMTHAELDQGVGRLQATGLAEASPAGLAVTEEGRRLVEQAGQQTKDVISQLTALAVLLEASEAPSLPPSECMGAFVRRTEYDAAVARYHEAFRLAARKQRK